MSDRGDERRVHRADQPLTDAKVVYRSIASDASSLDSWWR